MTTVEDSYLVLGDLRNAVDGVREQSGPFIVRMFVGDITFDEEISCDVDALDQVVRDRMAELTKTPDPALEVDAQRPLIDPGHAIDIPGVTS